MLNKNRVNIQAVKVQDDDEIRIGSYVVFNPPETSYVYGCDGVIQRGDKGCIIKITEDKSKFAPRTQTCHVYFPRVIAERHRKGMPSILFFAHPSELISLDTELCKKYNVVAHKQGNFGEYHFCDDPHFAYHDYR